MINAIHTLRDGRALTIRQAVHEDTEALISLIQNILSTTTYTLTKAEEFDTSPEAQEIWIRQYLDNPAWILLVAELDGQLVGNLDFRNNPKVRNQHIGEFGMGVLEEHRGQGIGSIILKEFLAWAKGVPVLEKINLSVMTMNDGAVKLYQSLGFQEQGRHPKAIKLDDGDYAEVIEMYLFI